MVWGSRVLGKGLVERSELTVRERANNGGVGDDCPGRRKLGQEDAELEPRGAWIGGRALATVQGRREVQARDREKARAAPSIVQRPRKDDGVLSV